MSFASIFLPKPVTQQISTAALSHLPFWARNREQMTDVVLLKRHTQNTYTFIRRLQILPGHRSVRNYRHLEQDNSFPALGTTNPTDK